MLHCIFVWAKSYPCVPSVVHHGSHHQISSLCYQRGIVPRHTFSNQRCSLSLAGFHGTCFGCVGLSLDQSMLGYTGILGIQDWAVIFLFGFLSRRTCPHILKLKNFPENTWVKLMHFTVFLNAFICTYLLCYKLCNCQLP